MKTINIVKNKLTKLEVEKLLKKYYYSTFPQRKSINTFYQSKQLSLNIIAKANYSSSNNDKFDKSKSIEDSVLINKCKKDKIETHKYTHFNELNENHILFFIGLLGKDYIMLDKGNSNSNDNNHLDKYNKDWLKKFIGNSKLVLKPVSVKEISEILKYCNKEKLALVPQGGNTGLVGGSVPIYDEIILSMERLNKIISFDETTNVVEAEAGVILEQMNNYLEENFNRVFPLDLGAKGSCMLGGNLATNAGGIHFIQFGSLKSNIEEIEFVTTQGEIIVLNINNDPFGLRNIIIGSEGTLGVITKLKMRTYEKKKFSNALLLRLPSFKKLIYFYNKFKSELSNSISAIEFFDSYSMKLTEEMLMLENPFEQHLQQSDESIDDSSNLNKFNFSVIKNEFYLLLELQTNTNETDNIENILNLLDHCIEEDYENDVDSIFSQDETQLRGIWELRERISEASVKKGYCFKYDVSLNLKDMYSLVEILREKIGDKALVIGYGHVGDCNVHINICLDSYEKNDNFYDVLNILEPFIFDYLREVNGSISAEHGVGQCKVDYLNRNHSEENIELMRRIKQSFDPNLILNPYKVIRMNYKN